MPNEPSQLRLLVEILQTCRQTRSVIFHFGKKFEHLRFTYQESDNKTFKHTRQIYLLMRQLLLKWTTYVICRWLILFKYLRYYVILQTWKGREFHGSNSLAKGNSIFDRFKWKVKIGINAPSCITTCSRKFRLLHRNRIL